MEAKPIIGLKPKYIHDEERRVEIFEAMQRYAEVQKPIPIEWVVELKILCLQSYKMGM